MLPPLLDDGLTEAAAQAEVSAMTVAFRGGFDAWGEAACRKSR
jgi:hypothetical protein